MPNAKTAIVAGLVVIVAAGFVMTIRDYYSNAGPVIRSVCLSNLRQLGQAMTIYVESNDNRYPSGYVLQSRPKYPALLTCPTVQRAGGEGGYVLNSDLLNMPKGDAGTKTIVFFERDAAAPGDVGPLRIRGTHRHGNRSNVVFEDGNAASLPNP